MSQDVRVRVSPDVQIWDVKAVRIRQRDCKSRPNGSGSSPPQPTIGTIAQLVEHQIEALGVVGSSPTIISIKVLK